MKKELNAKKIILMIIGALVGALGGQFLVEGELQLTGIIPTLIGFSIAGGIMVLLFARHKRKYGDIPMEDERGRLRGQKFVITTLVLTLYGGIFLLTILYYNNRNRINIYRYINHHPFDSTTFYKPRISNI